MTFPWKVTVASSGLGHVARGIEAWAADLAAALAGRGVRVTLCKGGGRAEAAYERVLPCWRRGGPEAERLLRWLPRRLGWRLGLGSGYGVEQATFALGLLRHLRTAGVDLLHVQDPHLARIAQRARRLGLVRTRTVLAHGTEEAPEFLRRFTYVQHLAPWHLDEARAAGAWKPTWIAIPNFIDTDRFRPGPDAGLRAELGIPADARVVLTAAAIKRHHKRVDHLLAEFAGLCRRRPEWPLYLVVAGGWEPETDGLVAEGRRLLGERVRFLVRCPRERMPAVYRLADVFALCSLKEMMPVALLEAAASGLPCVVHRHPVLAWVAGPGGVAVDMAAPEALATALEILLADPDRRAETGRHARRHCEGHFSRDRVVDQVLDYYRTVLSNGRGAARRRPAALQGVARP